MTAPVPFLRLAGLRPRYLNPLKGLLPPVFRRKSKVSPPSDTLMLRKKSRHSSASSVLLKGGSWLLILN